MVNAAVYAFFKKKKKQHRQCLIKKYIDTYQGELFHYNELVYAIKILFKKLISKVLMRQAF